MIVPAGVKPSFVKTRDEISPFEINEKFQSGPSYGSSCNTIFSCNEYIFRR